MANNCCNLIESLGLTVLDPQKSISLHNILYINQVQGWLYHSKLNTFANECIIILKVVEQINSVEIATNKKIKLNEGIYIINDLFDIELNANCQTVIVNKAFYQCLGMPNLTKGVIKHIHEDLILSLFDSIFHSGKPEYEIMALVNLIGVDVYNRQVKGEFDKISKIITQCCKSQKFNLDVLCSHAHMSRRKIQYILSENNSSFMNLTQLCRLRLLKQSLYKEPNVPLIKLVEQCGFRNVGMAKRAFIKHNEQDLTSFKKHLKTQLIS